MVARVIWLIIRRQVSFHDDIFAPNSKCNPRNHYVKIEEVCREPIFLSWAFLGLIANGHDKKWARGKIGLCCELRGRLTTKFIFAVSLEASSPQNWILLCFLVDGKHFIFSCALVLADGKKSSSHIKIFS
jgi:hypothetical protein